MFGLSRQRRPYRLGLCALIALTMVLMPVGQPMPAPPSADTVQSGSETTQRTAVNNRFGVLTEDDLEVEHHDFIVIQQLIREAPPGTTGGLISFLWTERLHRPPIA